MADKPIIAILGAGAWGTALAALWGNAGYKITLWARHAEQASVMQATRRNEKYLPQVVLSPQINITSGFDSLNTADIYLITLPAQYMRAQLQIMAPFLTATAPLILCNKGIETATQLLMPQVAAQLLPQHTIGILSGPNLAPEVAQLLPAAATLALPTRAKAQLWAQALSTPSFRLYASDDITGTAIGGALKNVIAIAAGIVAGAGLGDNARAALITRGLAELSRLGLAMAAYPETLTGLSGLGDLMLTATAAASRNYSFGYELGTGKSAADILASRANVTEGVATAAAALTLAAHYNIELPICAAVNDVIIKGKKIPDVLTEFMARPLKLE